MARGIADAMSYQIGRNTKKFDGKIFTLKDIRFQKGKANEAALDFQRAGWNYRITVTGRVLSHAHLYLIWARKKGR